MSNWLVPPMRIGLFHHIEYIYIRVFLVLYLRTASLSSLKIMKKSPITEYSDNDDNDKDDNMSCVRMWFEFLDGLLRCQNP